MPSPELSFYADPQDGFQKQITELRGLVSIVPPLVAADRQRRWDEIGQRPGNPDVDMIDIYESEAGEEEGFGHADFARSIYTSAVVTGWELFRDYLSYELTQRFLNYDLSSAIAVAASVSEEKIKCEQNFDHLTRRYNEWANVKLSALTSWDSIQHARKLRNLLVHGFGVYSAKYLKDARAIRPTKDELYGLGDPADDKQLIGREQVPMREADVLSILSDLATVAAEARKQLDAQKT